MSDNKNEDTIQTEGLDHSTDTKGSSDEEQYEEHKKSPREDDDTLQNKALSQLMQGFSQQQTKLLAQMSYNQDTLVEKLENSLVEGVQKIADIRYGSLTEQHLSDIKEERAETRSELKHVFRHALDESREVVTKTMDEKTFTFDRQHSINMSELRQLSDQRHKEMIEVFTAKHTDMIEAMKSYQNHLVDVAKDSQATLKATLIDTHQRMIGSVGETLERLIGSINQLTLSLQEIGRAHV
jgi:hypothetical protein